jgi:hypothetical protein
MISSMGSAVYCHLQADWDVPPPAMKQLVREAAESDLLTPILCVNAQKQLDSLLSIVSDYVPSMLGIKVGPQALVEYNMYSPSIRVDPGRCT